MAFQITNNLIADPFLISDWFLCVVVEQSGDIMAVLGYFIHFLIFFLLTSTTTRLILYRLTVF